MAILLLAPHHALAEASGSAAVQAAAVVQPPVKVREILALLDDPSVQGKIRSVVALLDAVR